MRWLLDAFPRTRWFFDVHSFSQLILYNWGDDNNQTADPAMNFRNPAFDDDRGLLGDAAYNEYIPAGDELIARTLAERMRDAIAAVRGKTYTAKQSVGLYPTCGTSQDYAYSRHFVDPSKGKSYSYTIEWGTVFQPDWSEMELIIQDVSAGLIDFCVAAPCAGGLIGLTLDTPSLQFIDVPAGEETVRVAVFTIQTCGAVTIQVSITRENFKKYLSDDRYRGSQTPASSAVHGLRYSLNVHTFSSLRMTVQIVPSSYEPGATLTLRAVLIESSCRSSGAPA